MSTNRYEDLSTDDLQKLLKLRGSDVPTHFDRSNLISAARDLDRIDYDEEARKLFARLNLTPNKERKLWAPLDPVWCNPETGGTLYVGNYVGASDRKTLNDKGIKAVVNCQDLTSTNYFEEDGDIAYFRFAVSRLALDCCAEMKNSRFGAFDAFRPSFNFVDDHLQRGQSVLIHCLAGAHRAGTLGVAYLMYKMRIGVDEAIHTAKQCRPVIGPFGTLLELLHYLCLDMKHT